MPKKKKETKKQETYTPLYKECECGGVDGCYECGGKGFLYADCTMEDVEDLKEEIENAIRDRDEAINMQEIYMEEAADYRRKAMFHGYDPQCE